MILLFSLKISLCGSQTCVVQLEEKDKYKIEKKRDNLYKDRYIQFLLRHHLQRNDEFDEKTHMERDETQKPYILLKNG